MSRVKFRRASDESVASADDSIEETHSVMSFIMSRLPDDSSILAEVVGAASSGLVAGGATASTTTLAFGAAGGDGAPALPPPFPVEVRKQRVHWSALGRHWSAYLRRLLRLMLLLVAHATLLVAFVEAGWDRNNPWCQGPGLLLLLVASLDVCLAFGYCFRWRFHKKASSLIDRANKQLSRLTDTKCFSRCACAVVLTGMLVFVAIDSRLHRPRVTAVTGVVLLVGFGYIFSKNRSKVKWRPVVSGLLLQFVLGLLLVRWHVGRSVLVCFAEKIAAIISFAGRGGSFVFGYLSTGELEGGLPRQEPVLAVTVVSTMVFFGLLVSVLCHYGLLQCLAFRFARLIAAAIGTTALESYCSACNIYLGMIDSAVLLRPYLAQLTRSELHAVMTCGFATISGSLFAVFTVFGVKAEHMVAASVMSAPAALGFSKLFYPETEDSSSSLESIRDIQRRCRPDYNAFESVARGMSSLLAVAANVAASLLGFVACVALADAVFAYVCATLGWKLVTVNWLLGRLFVPLTLVMGLSVDESSRVASLVGLKTMLNEVFAQSEMGRMARNGRLSPRAQLICTHALCGFSSLAALGVQLGVFAALAPERLPDCARVAGRALVAGSIACFLTACTAGALMDTTVYEVPTLFNSYDFV
ncbi:putative transporter YutK [Dermacentor variabilis]|uniref:putative transporter YutK n=1 Tax=Dermacentor variabilis TaxID=34621 RepID=UPI003F5B0471